MWSGKLVHKQHLSPNELGKSDGIKVSNLKTSTQQQRPNALLNSGHVFEFRWSNAIWIITAKHGKSCDTISFVKLKYTAVFLKVATSTLHLGDVTDGSRRMKNDWFSWRRTVLRTDEIMTVNYVLERRSIRSICLSKFFRSDCIVWYTKLLSHDLNAFRCSITVMWCKKQCWMSVSFSKRLYKS